MTKGEGIVSKRSPYSVEETVSRLSDVLRKVGITIFALVDHSGEAAKVGMNMPPTKLLIFGNPAAGTPIMLAAPLAAIDLPLKALVWQDGSGEVWVSYNDPAYLRHRFELSEAEAKAIAGAGALVEKAIA